MNDRMIDEQWIKTEKGTARGLTSDAVSAFARRDCGIPEISQTQRIIFTHSIATLDLTFSKELFCMCIN
jgi:hypothetical protein